MARVEPRFRRGDEITAAVKRVRPGGWPRRDDLFLAHFHHESTLVLPRVTPTTLPRLDHEQRPVEYFRFRCSDPRRSRMERAVGIVNQQRFVIGDEFAPAQRRDSLAGGQFGNAFSVYKQLGHWRPL